VPDRTPEAEASAEDSKRSESCAGGLPTENAAKGETSVLIDVRYSTSAWERRHVTDVISEDHLAASSALLPAGLVQ